MCNTADNLDGKQERFEIIRLTGSRMTRTRIAGIVVCYAELFEQKPCAVAPTCASSSGTDCSGVKTPQKSTIIQHVREIQQISSDILNPRSHTNQDL